MKKMNLLLALAWIAFYSCTNPEVSDIGIVRKQNFDFDWKFSLGDTPEAKENTFDDTQWRNLDLPHDWSIEGEFNIDNSSGNDGGYLPTGIGWYRKTFHIPASWDGKQIAIYFEGSYMNNTVYVNGKEVGFHPYGYTSFEFDLTPYIKFGQKNIIAVRVDNSSQKNCRWYTGSGIYRHVWLSVKNKVNIPNWGVNLFTKSINDNKATIEVKTKVRNSEPYPQQIVIVTDIYDNGTKTNDQSRQEINLDPNQSQDVIFNIEVHNPKLWSVDTPFLYEAKTTLIVDKQVVDFASMPLGIRTIAYSSGEGFLLNGENVIFNGACIHSDNGALGAAAYDRAEERKIELLKSAGFNAVRTSHNPPSEALLNACDKLGMLVIDEVFDGWRASKTPYDYSTLIDTYWKKDVAAFVLRDINHPSVIIWSTGNEIIERTSSEAIKTARMLNGYVHELDPSRPVTAAHASWGEGWDVFDSLMNEFDIVGYNYYMHEAENDHKRVPERIIIQTESYPRDAFSNWAMVDKHSYILGDFVWTGMDYLGESGIGRYFYEGETPGQHYQAKIFPWHGAYCGDIDQIGRRKPISHYRNILYNINGNEKIFLAVKEPSIKGKEIHETYWSVWPTWESWTWDGHEGKNIDVEVYSRYPKVRLYLNNELIGEKPTTYAEEFKATFTLPYQRGELKAVGISNNKEEEVKILRTAGEVATIRLIADRTTIKADGQDLAFITIELFDKDGVYQANADNLLSFDLQGNGEIVGVDNANLKDLMSYKGTERKAWKGRALAIVKSTQQAGDLILRVKSDGLLTAKVKIKTVK